MSVRAESGAPPKQMDDAVQKRGSAWQPFSPKGIAAFSVATLGRLLLAQFVFAIIIAASVMWFLRHAWFPVVSQAINQLPPNSEVRQARLNWQGTAPACLAGNRFLTIAVDSPHSGEARSAADIVVEFGERDLRIISLFGFSTACYPAGWRIALNRAELQPWWGAWSPAILASAGAFAVVGLMLEWAFLAGIYLLPVRLAAYLANRALGPVESWRLAAAAMMPATLVLSGAIILYGTGALDLVQFLVAGGLHLPVGLVFVAAGVAGAPRSSAAEPANLNPFAKDDVKV